MANFFQRQLRRAGENPGQSIGTAAGAILGGPGGAMAGRSIGGMFDQPKDTSITGSPEQMAAHRRQQLRAAEVTRLAENLPDEAARTQAQWAAAQLGGAGKSPGKVLSAIRAGQHMAQPAVTEAALRGEEIKEMVDPANVMQRERADLVKLIEARRKAGMSEEEIARTTAGMVKHPDNVQFVNTLLAAGPRDPSLTGDISNIFKYMVG